VDKDATRSDWKTLPVPSQWAPLTVDMNFTADEFTRIRAGRIPDSMEDKWFVYFEQPWLSIHRSWTGLCIYHLRIDPDGDGFRVTKALANREGSLCETSGEQDILLLSALLAQQAGRESRELFDEFFKFVRRRDAAAE
jgi:hypothetical protein